MNKLPLSRYYVNHDNVVIIVWAKHVNTFESKFAEFISFDLTIPVVFTRTTDI